MKINSVSIIVPVFDEINTIDKVCTNISNLRSKINIETIFVDDGSKDGSRAFLLNKKKTRKKNTKFRFHKKNLGKGAAIKTGLTEASGEYVFIQDADLEYQPKQLFKLVKKAEKESARVVYGSRNKDIKNDYFNIHYYFGMKIITSLINILYSQNLTDPETCQKLINRKLLSSIEITENGFGVEIELTAKLSKKGKKIVETSIPYKPRSFEEGKKIKVKDGLRALCLVFKYLF